jgi:hemoglobin
VNDLRGRADLELLLREFYGRAFEEPLLGHVFVDVVRMDLEEHLPVIVDFWEKVLFNTGTYSGQAMAVHRRVHRRVPLTGEHFTRWLHLWRESLDARFSGPVAEQADQHARRMASVFLRNLTSAEHHRRSLPVVARTASAANSPQTGSDVTAPSEGGCRV